MKSHFWCRGYKKTIAECMKNQMREDVLKTRIHRYKNRPLARRPVNCNAVVKPIPLKGIHLFYALFGIVYTIPLHGFDLDGKSFLAHMLSKEGWKNCSMR